MQGFLEYLLSDLSVSKYLISKFNFYIYPMLNPDGVRYGNYRCNITGDDLNRNWKEPNANYLSELCAVKEHMRKV